jgi:predicted PurR-regulated permease PerM
MQEIIPQVEPSQEAPAPEGRQIVLATLAVAGTLLAFWLLFQLRNIVLLLLAAIVLATALQPVINRLQRLGLSRTLSGVITYVLFVALLVGAGVLIVPILANQATAISGVIPEYYGKARAVLFQSSSWPVRRLAMFLPSEAPILMNAAPAGPLTEEQMLERVTQLFNYLGIGARTLFGIIGVFLLAFYWSLERDRTIRWLVALFPVNKRRAISSRIDDVEGKLEVFLAAQGTLCLIIGVASLAAYLIIGLPYALLLALLAGIAEAVPLIGPLLGAIPALFIALTLDPSKVAGVLIATAVIQVLENNLIVPKVMSKAVGANPVVTLVTLLVFSYLLGIAGALIAVPVAVTMQWLAQRTVQALQETSTTPSDQRGEVSVLRYQAQELMRDVRKQMSQEAGATSSVDEAGDAIESVADQLDDLLADIEGSKIA